MPALKRIWHQRNYNLVDFLDLQRHGKASSKILLVADVVVHVFHFIPGKLVSDGISTRSPLSCFVTIVTWKR
jgi:hypothetical protein